MNEVIIENFREIENAMNEKKIISLDEDMIMVTAGCCWNYSVEKCTEMLRKGGYVLKEGKYHPMG